MKNKIIITLAALLCFADNSPAQDSWYSKIIGFAQQAEGAKELTFAAYPGYAPDLVIEGVKKPWGGGIAALYPVLNDTLNGHAFTGLRLDYMGDQFWAPSLSLGLQADVQVFGHNFKPFTIAGAIVPLAGAGDKNQEVGAIFGAGVRTSIWKSKNEKFGVSLFYAAERWTIFSGIVHRPGIALTAKF